MQYKPKLCLLQVLGVILLGIPHIAPEVSAQDISTCSRALGEAYLDVNNVRARILNTGGLWYRGEPHVYEVPKGSGSNALFAGGIWIAGQVDGQLRASATRYGEWEFWAGPLGDNGEPPVDCSVYDRVYKISSTDLASYDLSGEATTDLADWPTGLGAPTLDANGDQIDLLDQPLGSRADRVINLEAGERPAILGDQMIWWVMNDRGNVHTSTDSDPIGLEVHGTAFAFDIPGHIGNATFYKFNLWYKGASALEETYISIWADVDLGNFDDDWAGSDTTLGLGYVYNSDNFDEGSEGYGSLPPAVGFDFLQGPVVPSPGDTALVSGVPVFDAKNLDMTSYSIFYSGGGVQGGPGDAEGYYNYMRSRWLDGKHFTWGGRGRDFSEIPIDFMWPGDPVTNTCWTERNSDCFGTEIPSGDIRFAMSAGPFTISTGDRQEIIFGAVWAKGLDNFDSVRALREADRLAQSAYDVNFVVAEDPSAPDVQASIFDGGVTLSWTNEPGTNNYLESYDQLDPFAPLGDNRYVFEGYKVIQFEDEFDEEGTVIATYDIVNGVTTVIDLVYHGADPPYNELNEVTSDGTDSGITHAFTITGLTNLGAYYYGVQAYAYNESSTPKILDGESGRITVIPHLSEDLYSTAAVEAALSRGVPDFVGETTSESQGQVTADVLDPAAIVEDATYVTRFYELEGASIPDSAFVVTYDIERHFGGEVEKVFDGSATGQAAPQRADVILIDGLQFSITGPAPGMTGFKMIANNAGPLDPPDMAAFAFNSSGFPRIGGRDRPEGGRNQSTNGSTWGIHVGGGNCSYYGNENGPFNDSSNCWVGRSIREGSVDNPWPNIGTDDFEWRFPQLCFNTLDGSVSQDDCVSWRGFGDGDYVEVPFTVWNTGSTSDPGDDYRMLPLICESECDGNGIDDVFDIAGDHIMSGGDNDPYSDWIYWYKPEDNGATAGEQGYLDFFWGSASTGDRTFSRQVLVNWNGGSQKPYDADLPEPGSIIQYKTKKINQPGDSFSFNTAGYGATPASDSLKTTRLKEINVVPNPYMLASAYEKQLYQDEVRFSNFPLEESATLRIFTLHGQLIQTLIKPAGVNQLSWDLKTSASLPIGSGMYLIHVDVDGIGTHVIKFAAILKRLNINLN